MKRSDIIIQNALKINQLREFQDIEKGYCYFKVVILNNIVHQNDDKFNK